MIVVFGATGNTGAIAARHLLSLKREVRVVGRNKTTLSPFVALGATAAEADMENLGDVQRALEGASIAYVLIPPNFATKDFRQYQQRVTANLGRALEDSDCRKVVMLSSLGAQHPAGTGPIVGLYELEQRLKPIARLDLLTIRAGYFMENFLSNISMIQAMGILGAPAPAEAPMSLIAASDIGRYVGARLASGDVAGFEVVNLIGPALVTLAEATRAIGTAIGKPELPYVQFAYEDARQGMVAQGLSEQMASLYVELYQGAAQGLLQPEDGTRVEHTKTTFVEFSQIFAAAYRSASAA